MFLKLGHMIKSPFIMQAIKTGGGEGLGRRLVKGCGAFVDEIILYQNSCITVGCSTPWMQFTKIQCMIFSPTIFPIIDSLALLNPSRKSFMLAECRVLWGERTYRTWHLTFIEGA